MQKKSNEIHSFLIYELYYKQKIIANNINKILIYT